MQHQAISRQSNGSSSIEALQYMPEMNKSLDMDSDSNSSRQTKDASVSSSDSSDQIRIKFEDWGFKVDRLFEVAYRFYKRNESKAFHPSFDERNKMIALIMQAKYGNCDGGRAPDIGALDLVGKRRQYEWSLLNGMSKTEAMSKFIYALDDLCPIFKAHAEAVKISSGFEQNHKSQSESKSDKGGSFASQNPAFNPETNPQMHNIYSSLCKQTYNQFKGYAEKQCPNDLVGQKYLISSLQEQYYQQYISQMYPELKVNLPDSSLTSNESSNTPSSTSSPTTSDKLIDNESTVKTNEPNDVTPISKEQTMLPVTLTDDLVVATEEIASHEQTKDPGDNKLMSNDVPDSMRFGASNCEENNEQADISCEELNSGPVNDSVDFQNNVNHNSANQIAHKLGSMSISPDTSDNIEQTQLQSIDEPKRLHQNFDLPPIGMFESFPEPKPVRHSHQKSTPIEQINPNLPPTSMSVLEKNYQDSQTGSQLVQDNQSASQSKVELNVESNSAQQDDTYFPINLDTNHNIDKNQLQYDHMLEESNTFPSQQTIDIQDDSHQDQATVQDDTAIASNIDDNSQRVPELWGSASSDGASSPVEPTIPYDEPEPATIWSKRGVAEFKESLGDDKQGGVYEVKESTLVVIQVPTYSDGKYIYWEFATDDYDIGFGVEFVYDRHLSQPLALNIYEDMDDDDLESMIEEDNWSTNANTNKTYDPELGEVASQSAVANNPYQQQDSSWRGAISERDRLLSEKRQRLANTISIVPTYRRDSHEEVFVGRHKYPGQGYYLLKFDNTYSVLRSKTLYFRICYFM